MNLEGHDANECSESVNVAVVLKLKTRYMVPQSCVLRPLFLDFIILRQSGFTFRIPHYLSPIGIPLVNKLVVSSLQGLMWACWKAYILIHNHGGVNHKLSLGISLFYPLLLFSDQ